MPWNSQCPLTLNRGVYWGCAHQRAGIWSHFRILATVSVFPISLNDICMFFLWTVFWCSLLIFHIFWTQQDCINDFTGNEVKGKKSTGQVFSLQRKARWVVKDILLWDQACASAALLSLRRGSEPSSCVSHQNLNGWGGAGGGRVGGGGGLSRPTSILI